MASGRDASEGWAKAVFSVIVGVVLLIVAVVPDPVRVVLGIIAVGLVLVGLSVKGYAALTKFHAGLQETASELQAAEVAAAKGAVAELFGDLLLQCFLSGGGFVDAEPVSGL